MWPTEAWVRSRCSATQRTRSQIRAHTAVTLRWAAARRRLWDHGHRIGLPESRRRSGPASLAVTVFIFRWLGPATSANCPLRGLAKDHDFRACETWETCQWISKPCETLQIWIWINTKLGFAEHCETLRNSCWYKNYPHFVPIFFPFLV